MSEGGNVIQTVETGRLLTRAFRSDGLALRWLTCTTAWLPAIDRRRVG